MQTCALNLSEQVYKCTNGVCQNRIDSWSTSQRSEKQRIKNAHIHTNTSDDNDNHDENAKLPSLNCVILN